MEVQLTVSNEAWAAALQEVESPQREPGLWAKCFAEADGNEAKAKAAYIRERVASQGSADPPAPAPAAAMGFCPNCGRKCAMDAEKCPHCNAQFGPFGWKPQHSPPRDGLAHQSQPPPVAAAPSPVYVAKSRGVYVILGLFFGLLGVHNFYAGRFGVGVCQLLTVLILGWFVIGLVIVAFWVLIELFTVTLDGNGNAFG